MLISEQRYVFTAHREKPSLRCLKLFGVGAITWMTRLEPLGGLSAVAEHVEFSRFVDRASGTQQAFASYDTEDIF